MLRAPRVRVRAMSLRITVVGCGYLGATHAACMAELGFDVLGLDVDEAKVATLERGRGRRSSSPGLEPMLRKHVETGRLRFTHVVRGGGGVRRRALRLRRPRRRRAASTPPTSRYVDAAVAAPRAVLERPVRRRRQVHRPGGDGGPAGRSGSPSSPRRARPSTWRGTRSSSARATPSTTRCARTGSCSGSRRRPRDAEAMLREIYASDR